MPKSTANTGGVTAPAITPHPSISAPGARGWRDYALLLALACAWLLVRLQPATTGHAAARSSDRDRIGGSAWAGLRAVFASPYLAGIAGYVLLMTVVATFIYFTRLQMVAAVADDMDTRAAILGNIDMWTQVAVLVLQVTLTGHIIRRLGLGVALALLPIAMAAGFLGLAIYGSFVVLILLEATNRAVQRGLTRPARETLFTVVGVSIETVLGVAMALIMARALRAARRLGIDAVGSPTPSTRFRTFRTQREFLLREVYFFHRDLLER